MGNPLRRRFGIVGILCVLVAGVAIPSRADEL